jgi:hypothetical protein
VTAARFCSYSLCGEPGCLRTATALYPGGRGVECPLCRSIDETATNDAEESAASYGRALPCLACEQIDCGCRDCGAPCTGECACAARADDGDTSESLGLVVR